MTLEQALRRARGMLAAHNIEDATLESELLLRHTLNISLVQMYQDLSREISPADEKTYHELVQRRLNGEPAAYITGHIEFYGLDFHVDPRVLIPRPESELLVAKALALMQNHPTPIIAEIGTGSGAVAISVALNLPQARIYATDISAAALQVARINCEKHGVTARVSLLQGDLLDPLPETVDLIIANLPYVTTDDAARLQPEPRLALDGGADGLDKIVQLCRQVGGKLRPPGSLLLEIGQGQGGTVTGMLRRLFPAAKVEVFPDLSGIERLVSLTLTI